MCIGKAMIIRKGQRHPDYLMDSNDHAPLVDLTCLFYDGVGWPRVLVDPNFRYEGEHIRERAIADGLTGWGNCYAGHQRPD